MGDARIEFTIGGISFAGEGEDTWLATQLDKIIEKAPDLIKIAPKKPSISETGKSIGGDEQQSEDAAIATQSLPNFLKSKNASRSVLLKFLATAIWLQAKGANRISTGDVTKALRDSSQSRLGNPSDCLAKNVSKGYIEKDGKQFFVTDEGKASL